MLHKPCSTPRSELIQAVAPLRTDTYDSFGKLSASTRSLVNPFQCTARESDTGTGLYYHNHLRRRLNWMISGSLTSPIELFG